ncbi:hypothetical protein HK104_009027 [Borealophlyctis nickersoniae]|nr:hypothetical protein HK104_009027 [Borealophlyctis nickersoniae]
MMMMFKLATLSTILLLASTQVLSLPASLSIRDSPCGAVHILSAHGANAPPGPDLTVPLVTQIKTRLAASTSTIVTSETIRFTASFLPSYPSSAAEGTEAVKSQLLDAASRCPTPKIVLIGYSEGAHIVGEALGGGGDGHFLGPKTPGMNASIIREHVKAVVLLGDPRHNIADPWSVGPATRGGLFPRDAEPVAALKYNCAFGGFFKHQDDATDFVAGKV